MLNISGETDVSDLTGNTMMLVEYDVSCELSIHGFYYIEVTPHFLLHSVLLSLIGVTVYKTTFLHLLGNH